jgi:hypothetical protein
MQMQILKTRKMMSKKLKLKIYLKLMLIPKRLKMRRMALLERLRTSLQKPFQ